MTRDNTATRRRLYTLLAVANRELSESRPGWSDDDYRFILQQCGARDKDGQPSATTMTVPQMEVALTRFKELGFRVRKNGAGWRGPRIAKLTAIWCALADAGVVRNRSRQAMESFLRRQVSGMSHLEWASSDDLNHSIEILKKWASRCEVELD